jgi:hypothetical protein
VHRQVVSSLILFYFFFVVVFLSRFQKKMHSFSYAAAAAWTPVQTTQRDWFWSRGSMASSFFFVCYVILPLGLKI